MIKYHNNLKIYIHFCVLRTVYVCLKWNAIKFSVYLCMNTHMHTHTHTRHMYAYTYSQMHSIWSVLFLHGMECIADTIEHSTVSHLVANIIHGIYCLLWFTGPPSFHLNIPLNIQRMYANVNVSKTRYIRGSPLLMRQFLKMFFKLRVYNTIIIQCMLCPTRALSHCRSTILVASFNNATYNL